MSVAKVVRGKQGTAMTVLGKQIWRAACKMAGERGIVNVVGWLSADVLPLGEKTLRRRLNDDEWLLRDLIQLQQTLKDRNLQEFINTEFESAIQS